MIAMDQIKNIKSLYFEQGMNLSEIAEETGFDWKTVKKYVDKEDFNVPPPQPKNQPGVSKLDPYKPQIDEWLEEDQYAPRKQRHTAVRIFERLRDEKGYDGCRTLVIVYVGKKKKEMQTSASSGFIPLVHHPGESQGDFGTATFVEKGQEREGKYFVLSFPYSNAGYIQLKYGENLECLTESLVSIFEHIGGVPPEIWFDNASAIVNGIIKDGGRNVSERFTRFQLHYGFKPVFMNPASGWEKGNVENKVGYSRRKLLVPVPKFDDLNEYNKELLTRCVKDADRDHYRIDASIASLHEGERAFLLPLPSTAYDTCRYEIIKCDKWGKFKFGNPNHEYSASPEYSEKEVLVKASSTTVEVLDGENNVIATHKRLYGNTKQQSMDWLPYLTCIASKPRSLRNSGIYDMLPDNVKFYLDNCKNSDRGQILKALAELTSRTGFSSAVDTIDLAIQHEAHDADSLKNLYRSLYSDIPEIPPLPIQSEIPNVAPLSNANLAAYDSFLERRVENG